MHACAFCTLTYTHACVTCAFVSVAAQTLQHPQILPTSVGYVQLLLLLGYTGVTCCCCYNFLLLPLAAAAISCCYLLLLVLLIQMSMSTPPLGRVCCVRF